MANRIYEGMFLLNSNRYARDAKGVSEQISDTVKKCGGEVLVSRLWSEQKLAYPIRGQRKGTYWLTYFRLDGGELDRLKRETQLNTNVLRSLIISIDERLADTLVEHAASTGSAAPRPVTSTKSGEGDKSGEKSDEKATAENKDAVASAEK